MINILMNITFLIIQEPTATELSEKIKYTFMPSNAYTSLFLFFAFQLDIYKWTIFIVAS